MVSNIWVKTVYFNKKMFDLELSEETESNVVYFFDNYIHNFSYVHLFSTQNLLMNNAMENHGLNASSCFYRATNVSNFVLDIFLPPSVVTSGFDFKCLRSSPRLEMISFTLAKNSSPVRLCSSWLSRVLFTDLLGKVHLKLSFRFHFYLELSCFYYNKSKSLIDENQLAAL